MTDLSSAYHDMRMLAMILLDRLGGETIITEKELVDVDLSRDIEVELELGFHPADHRIVRVVRGA